MTPGRASLLLYSLQPIDEDFAPAMSFPNPNTLLVTKLFPRASDDDNPEAESTFFQSNLDTDFINDAIRTPTSQRPPLPFLPPSLDSLVSPPSLPSPATPSLPFTPATPPAPRTSHTHNRFIQAI